MKKLTFLLFLFALVASACSRLEEVASNDEQTKQVSFVVVNYEQLPMDDVTRASGAEVLDNLMLGVFDAKTGEQVLEPIVQKKGCEGYGTFTLNLPYGEYQLSFVGYQKDVACAKFSSTTISFADGYVPVTFLCNKNLTVNAETNAVESIVLKRAIAAFVIDLTDVIPSSVATIRFASTKGSASLNPQTGFAVSNDGRTHEVNVESSRNKSITISSYLYLPADECTTTYTVTALDANGNVVRERVFPDAPMQINCKTICQGAFFADDSFECKVQVDEAWGKDKLITY